MVMPFAKAMKDILALMVKILYFLQISPNTLASFIWLILWTWAAERTTCLVIDFNFVISLYVISCSSGPAEFLIPFRVFRE